MTTVAILDVNRKIIELTEQMNIELTQNGSPSPYFEELWYSLTVCLSEIQTTLDDHEARLIAGGL